MRTAILIDRTHQSLRFARGRVPRLRSLAAHPETQIKLPRHIRIIEGEDDITVAHFALREGGNLALARHAGLQTGSREYIRRIIAPMGHRNRHTRRFRFRKARQFLSIRRSLMRPPDHRIARAVRQHQSAIFKATALQQGRRINAVKLHTFWQRVSH